MLAMFALAACEASNRPPPPCPNIVIVQDVSDITIFKAGSGRDLTDVDLEAQIVEFGGFCDTDIDEDSRAGEVVVEMELVLRATRGPANTSRDGSLRYFVAIADSEQNILAREEFDTAVEFEGNRNRIAFREELTQTIPLKRGELGDDYSIFVGFQLSDDQLEYNLQKRGR